MESLGQNLRNVIKFIAVVAILIAVYLFVADLDLQRDMTEANIYSLTERSRSIAGKIDTPTTLYFFHTPTQGGRSQVDPQRVRTLLQQYARTNPRLSFKEVDHTKRPNLARQHNVQSNNTVLIQSGDRTKKIGRYDMLKIQRRRRGQTKFKGEAAITTALLKMTQATDRKVYFATGHGEYTHEPARRGSVSTWATGLKEEGYTVKEFNPLTSNLPDTRDLIVIVGPEEAYSSDILRAFSKWNRNGGNLLIAAGAKTGSSLNPLTKPAGVTYQAYYLIDPARRVQSLQSMVNPFVFAPKIRSHPSVKSIKDQGLGIQMGRSTAVTVKTDTAQAVLETSGDAFGKPANSARKKITTSFNPGTDERGPFTVGAVHSGSNRGKLLAFGSPTLFANTYLSQAPGNEDFALNLVNWVFDRDVSVGIRSTPSNYNRVSVPARQAYILQIIALGVIPLGIIFWGGWVWWSRKNR